MHGSELRKILLTDCKVVPTGTTVRSRRKIIVLLLVALLLGQSAQAQLHSPPGDWQAVKNLLPGTHISVKTQQRYRCSLESVTDDELVCGTRTPFKVLTLTIRRSEIHEVRISPRPNQAKDAWIGAGRGAGAGAITAGTNSRDYPGFHAFVGGAGGAAGGALVGGIVPIFQLLLQRGKVIYKW